MKQSTRDILATVSVLWIVGLIITVSIGHPLAVLFIGVPCVAFIAFVLVGLWLTFSGRVI